MKSVGLLNIPCKEDVTKVYSLAEVTPAPTNHSRK